MLKKSKMTGSYIAVFFFTIFMAFAYFFVAAASRQNALNLSTLAWIYAGYLMYHRANDSLVWLHRVWLIVATVVGLLLLSLLEGKYIPEQLLVLDMTGLLVTIGAVIIIHFSLLKYFEKQVSSGQNGYTEVAQTTSTKTSWSIPLPTIKMNPKADAIPEQFWEEALNELNSNPHQATWAKVFSQANGDEAKAKAAYLRDRAAALYATAVTKESASNLSTPESSVPPPLPLSGIASATADQGNVVRTKETSNKKPNATDPGYFWGALFTFVFLVVLWIFAMEEKKYEYKSTNLPSSSAYDLAESAYNSGRYEEAMRLWLPLAENGDPKAQNAIGSIMYGKGFLDGKDRAEACSWFRRAAEKGYSLALNNLGWCYALLGVGAERRANDNEAALWFRKSADLNDPVGQNSLGVMYLDGYGVPRDEAKALDLFLRSAEQGFASAQQNLSEMYRVGRGVPRDPKKAEFWKSKADAFRQTRDKGISMSYPNMPPLPAR